MSEIKAAAELARWMSDEGVSPDEDGLVRDIMVVFHKHGICAADDDLPIDEAWLLSIGFRKGGSPYARLIYRDYFTIDNMETGDCSVCDLSDRVSLEPRIKTRGQLRRLLSALGIEGK